MMDNLPELRDIHIPDGVSAFPPAYGWWVVLAGVVALFLLAELFLILRQASKKPRYRCPKFSVASAFTNIPKLRL